VPLFVIPRPLGLGIGPRPKIATTFAISIHVHAVTRPVSFMTRLSPLHAHRSCRPSGLHNPKAAHHSWSFAGLPDDSHRLCPPLSRSPFNDLPDFCLTTACSLRHKLIIEDLQHVSSLNLDPTGYQPAFSRCRAACATLTKQSHQPSPFTGSRRWMQLLTTALKPLRLAPLSAPAIYLPDIFLAFFGCLKLFPIPGLMLLPTPLSACAKLGFR